MSAIAKISKLLPSSLHFQKNAVPTILVEGLISPETYSFIDKEPFMFIPCFKEYHKIKIRSQYLSILEVVAMHKHTLYFKKLIKLPKETKLRFGLSAKNGL